MTEALRLTLEGQFERVNLRVPAQYENYSVAFVAGWCKGCWGEGLLIVDDADDKSAGRPFFVPWGNVASVQVGSIDNAHERQREAEEKFVPTADVRA